MMNLPTLDTVQKLQAALHAKAKGDSQYRFYSLYDKLYRKDVLWVAWRRCRAHGGVAGIDGQTFEDIEAYGVNKWLEELAEAYRAVDAHVTKRLRQWLCAKHKDPGRGTSRYPDEYLYQTLGLVRLPNLTHRFPWAKA